ncbi:hypothetical protein PEBR_38571 [Penicillium brasilianum]|uniref:Uncharacterized protein n=1 Tax=Penicillium brasilianum TaxID=104259 RepID=A0A1S9RC22_PENBI|nr:hypothetical protein PEBR_38571 [Penicillium brasilianum]
MKFENLVFTQSKSDFSLRFLISAVQFRVDPVQGVFRGKLTEYNPDCEKAAENHGTVHLVQGMKIKPEPSQGSTGTEPSGRLTPVKLGVDTGLLKKTTARYLEKVILYHMNEQERNDLTGSPKPRIGMDPKDADELPVELGDNLDDEPRDWLRDEYAVAFLASNLSKRSPEDQKKFHALFGNNYIKKLNYYYYEKGPRCLSRSPKFPLRQRRKRVDRVAPKSQFSFRGRIAPLGAKQEGVKSKSGEIPSWAQYTLVIQEHYADKDGVALEVLETKFVLEKKE